MKLRDPDCVELPSTDRQVILDDGHRELKKDELATRKVLMRNVDRCREALRTRARKFRTSPPGHR